jgi:hypothetical protein
MPRGSKPGERRGGRQKGTPNKSTTLKKVALSAASADPTTTPLQFLLDVMRDPKAPTGLRVQVARTAAPLVHARPGIARFGDRNAGAIGESDGFTIDMGEARAFRDIEHRRAALRRKRYGPSENGDPLTAAEIVEEVELDALIAKIAGGLTPPPGYGPKEVINDGNRLHKLLCKRSMPVSCGGGELAIAEDEEEAQLMARIAAYRFSPEGRDRGRLRELEFKEILRSTSPAEQSELDRLRAAYSEKPSEKFSTVGSR